MSMLRVESAEGRQPLLWSGFAATGLFFVLGVLQQLGVPVGTADSFLAGMLTCAGLAMAWGYLVVGANAGGGAPRLMVTGMLVVYVLLHRDIMRPGYAASVLLIGFAIFLAWRWYENRSRPIADLIVTGAIILLLFGIVAERAGLYQPVEGQNLLNIFLQLQAVFALVFAGSVLLTIGGAIGEATGSLMKRLGGLMVRVNPTALFLLVVAGGLAKAGFRLTHHAGAGWITGLALLGTGALWYWASRPRSEWQGPSPVFIALAGGVYMLVSFAGRYVLPPEAVNVTALYAPGVLGLGVGLVSLGLGRRSLALHAGMVGIYILFAAGNGENQSTVPGLSWLFYLPKLEEPVTDALFHLVMLGWAVILWIRGRRSPGPYALILAAMVCFLGVNLFDHMDKAPQSIAPYIPLTLFVCGTLYVLWHVWRGIATQSEAARLSFAGLSLGPILLTFTAGYWGQMTGLGDFYVAGSLPALGIPLFGFMTFCYAIMRQGAALTAERGDGR